MPTELSDPPPALIEDIPIKEAFTSSVILHIFNDSLPTPALIADMPTELAFVSSVIILMLNEYK